MFGVMGSRDSSRLVALGLHALQHRGQEACGIVSTDGAKFFGHHSGGLVGDVFGSAEVLDSLPGGASIGHNRYGTSERGSDPYSIQPFFSDHGDGRSGGGFAIAHNGHIVNGGELRARLVAEGAVFRSRSDSEVILHLLARASGSMEERVASVAGTLRGAWALVCLCRDRLIGARDELGIRPLVLGRRSAPSGGSDDWLLASESCAFDIIDGHAERDVKPGEIVTLMRGRAPRSLKASQTSQGSRACVFEYVYFSRPDSVAGGRSVYEARRRIGVELAREASIEADVVVPIPDSGVPSALGFSAESGIPFELGIIRNHYVGRTFIEPSGDIRHFGVKLKHNANRAQLENKRVVLVDDSLVRGTTSRKIVELVRRCGAREVHLCIASPPTRHPCFYGIDTPNRKDLLAANYSLADMESMLKVNSLSFVSLDGLYRAMGEARRVAASPAFCDACFSGDYPVAIPRKERQAIRKARHDGHAERQRA